MNIVKTICAAVALAATVTVSAQNANKLTFAHIDTQALVASLPEHKAAIEALQEEQKKLEDQLNVMSTDLQKKYEEYMQQKETMPELIRATKEKEIQDADQRIQSYQQMAQQSLSQKEQQLLMPILEKVQKAIDEVGKENGFVYIFNVTTQIILYHSEQSVDAAPLVLAKLGVN